MTLDFAPRQQLEQRLRDGWALVPGHDYARGDWAILMMAPVEGAVAASPAEIARAVARLAPLPRRPRMANVRARDESRRMGRLRQAAAGRPQHQHQPERTLP